MFRYMKLYARHLNDTNNKSALVGLIQLGCPHYMYVCMYIWRLLACLCDSTGQQLQSELCFLSGVRLPAGERSDTLGLLRLNGRKSPHRRVKKQRRYERLVARSQLSL